MVGFRKLLCCGWTAMQSMEGYGNSHIEYEDKICTHIATHGLKAMDLLAFSTFKNRELTVVMSMMRWY